tara:strand:- start:1483 stop:1824 length:342 start_codon:yes stop_codon:yes gene_type:complete
MKQSIIKIICFAWLLGSCTGVPLPQNKRDYAGEWQGDGVYLHITPTGGVEYRKLSGVSKVNITAPLKEFNGDGFVVGFLFLTTTFKVSSPPKKKDGRWIMTVDGTMLSKGIAH